MRLIFPLTEVITLGMWVVATSFASAAVTLFATDATRNINNLNTLSLVDGSATLVGPLGVNPIMAGLAYDAVNGILYGTTTATNNLYSINTTTGQATLIGPLGRLSCTD